MYGRSELDNRVYDLRALVSKLEGSVESMAYSELDEEHLAALEDVIDRAERLHDKAHELFDLARTMQQEADPPSADEARQAEIRED